MCVSVTVQHGVRMPVTLNSHDPKMCIEGNRFLLTGLQFWGGWGRSCSEPSSPTRPRAPLAPPKAISQKSLHSEVPISLSVLKPVMQADLHPLWDVHSWLSESPSSWSKQLSLSGSGVHCSLSPRSGPGPVCLAALDHSTLGAGAQEGTCLNLGPCTQEWASNSAGPKPQVHLAWSEEHSLPHREQGPETQRVHVHLWPKVPSAISTYQQTRGSLHKAEKWESPEPVEQRLHNFALNRAFPKHHMHRKPVGVSSFLTYGRVCCVCLCSFSSQGQESPVTLGGASRPHRSQARSQVCVTS